MNAREFVERCRISYPKLPGNTFLGLVCSKLRKNELNEKEDINAEFREEVCKEINRTFIVQDQLMVRYLIEQERRSRSKGCVYSANIRRCAYILFKLGKVEDAILIWNVKMYSGAFTEIDVQFLIGGGLAETVSYLQSKRGTDIEMAVNYIKHSIKFGEFENMGKFKGDMSNLFDDE